MRTLLAPGSPGITPRWTSSAKQGIGTAYNTASRVWFTLSHGIINEIYYPHVDSPNTRDLQLLITDGETFFHEEKRDLIHKCERPDPNAMLYRLTSSEPDGRYQIVKEVIGEPHSSVVLISVKLEVFDRSLAEKLRLFALLAPHVKDTGAGNTASVCDVAGRRLMHADREGVHLVMGCSTDFTNRSVGYVGASDGWTDLNEDFHMDWHYEVAADGNVAMMGEIDLSRGLEFTIGVGFGDTEECAATVLLQAFAEPFKEQRQKFIDQWKRTEQPKLSNDPDTNSLVRLSQHVLMAHEDKTFLGATVASMSIPWGETKDDRDAGGYHLVWARDMVQTTTAMLACDETDLPLRALIWLSCVQREDGGMPQNCEIDGTAYWQSSQLDEVAAPVILAWRLAKHDALRNFDPTDLIHRAVRYLILQGPVTSQERWEENSGYSPSTLSAIISAIVCAADFAKSSNPSDEAEFLLEYADWLVASLDSWCVTRDGELVDGIPRHFIRITPQNPCPGYVDPDPDTAMVFLGNGGGEHPARNIVDGGFLQLVRAGIMAPDDPVIVDSVAVIDAVLKCDLPQGPCWHRYNHDGYGQHDDGSAYNGEGVGRAWPLLTGERGHYELAAGRDATPYIKAMEGFAGDGGLLAEQLWDADDIPAHGMFFGKPAGSAMPLCWAHAEYISLVRSQRDGACFALIDTVYQRYVRDGQKSQLQIWTFAHQPARMCHGKLLRIICDARATVHWSGDNWSTQQDTPMKANSLGMFYADLPVNQQNSDSEFTFTFHWESDDRWEGKNYVVHVV